MTDVRCASKLHALLLEGDLIEVKCSSRFCGAGDGVTVLHRFDVKSGDLVETLQFKDPRKEQANGSRRNAPAVRSA